MGSGERRLITTGEETDRGSLEDKNPPDVVIVGTLNLRPHLPCSTYLASVSSPALILTPVLAYLEPKWPTTGCFLPQLGVTVAASLIFPAALAENKTRAVQPTRTCSCSIKQSAGRDTLHRNQPKCSPISGLKQHTKLVQSQGYNFCKTVLTFSQGLTNKK